LRQPHPGVAESVRPLVEGLGRGSAEEQAPPGSKHQHAGHPVDQFVQLVLDDDQRMPAVFSESPQEAEQLGGGLGVEVRRRLVQYQHSWAHGQDRGQSDPLFLPTRQGGQAAEPIPLQADPAQSPVDGRLYLLRRAAEILQAEGHLVFHRERAELGVGILKDQSGLLSQQMDRTFVHYQSRHYHVAGVVTLDQVRDQAVQAEGERTFSRSARPQHQHGLTWGDREREVDQRRLDPGGVGESQPGGHDGRTRSRRSQILLTFPSEIASPESTPVLARASPSSRDSTAPRTTELITARTAASPMLPHV
jgi:hypothetical protein